MPRQRRDVTNPKVQKNFMAPTKLLARLQAYAERIGESESEVIRLAVDEYLTAHEEGTQS